MLPCRCLEVRERNSGPVMILRAFATALLAVAAFTHTASATHTYHPHHGHAVGGEFHSIVDGLSRPQLVEPQGTPVGVSIVPLHHHGGALSGYSSPHVPPVTVTVTQVGVHQTPVISVPSAPASGIRDGSQALYASHLILSAVSSPGLVVHGAPVVGGAAYQPAASLKSEPVAALETVRPSGKHVQDIVARQQYSFGYEISDGHGNKQVRHEVSDGDNRKHGSYGFVDAHGVYRHVRYVADHNGFRATIDTNEPGVAAGYSAGAAYNRGKPAGKPVVLPPRPIPPPPHRGPPVFHEPVHVRPSAPVHGPVVQAVQALHKAVPVAPFPPSSVQYAPTVQQDGHSGGLAFIPSAPPLTAAASGGGFINPRSSHVTYVEEPSEHPFTNLRSSPPLFYEGYHQVHKHH